MNDNKWFWKKIQGDNGRVTLYAYTVCEKCGQEFQSNNAARAKYCPECKKIVVREQTRERVRNYRQGKKPAATSTL
jgi:predicted Zn-ribbon and HTH transcriptional regulator